jgi:CO dehydrogenase maturation factor
LAIQIAFAGKGGVGKTTVAGTLARLVAQRGHRVIAVDGDLNPNLAISLGLERSQAADLPTVPVSITGVETSPTGERRLVLKKKLDQIIGDYGTQAPDGVDLLLMGRPDHAGSG